MQKKTTLAFCLIFFIIGCSFHKQQLPSLPASAEKQFTVPDLPDPFHTRIEVSVSQQKLFLFEDNVLIRSYNISSARKGIGNKIGSFQTPLGLHRIYKKIGDGEPIGRVFTGREPMPDIQPILVMPPLRVAPRYMTTRILWLEGLEQGINRGGNVDTKSRYIYIHGTNLEGAIGTPDSYGCIYMKNKDVVELFNLVVEGTTVDIKR